MSDRACEFCAFWEKSEHGSRDGTCHRYPPTTIMKSEGRMEILGSVWAYTPNDAWCGEFRGKH